MTKTQLKKLKSLIKEAEHLKELIDRPACYGDYVTDTIIDYSTGYPRPQHIAGCGQANYARLRQRWYGKLREIQAEIKHLENWLDSVSDSQIRDILRLQYVNGLTQEEIADELGYTRETVSRKLKFFWKNEKQVTECHI